MSTFQGPLAAIPRGRAAILKVFGDIKATHDTEGNVDVSSAWERANMIMAKNLPGLAKSLYVHKLMAPYLGEALRRAQAWAPQYKINTIGCFNPRYSRHDPSRPLSLHSWGIAVDINSATNKPGTKGDMPPEFVKAFESVGFAWGGRWKSYRDDMHFQLAYTTSVDGRFLNAALVGGGLVILAAIFGTLALLR